MLWPVIHKRRRCERSRPEMPKLPGMREASGPVVSDVVQARLESLFAQLQAQVEPAAAESTHVESARVTPSGEDDDGWLARLRPAAEPAATPAGVTGDVGAQRVRVAAERVLAFSREHLATVVVILLVGVSWTAYSLLQARSTPVAEAVPVIQSSPTPSVTASASAAANVTVHVIGAVAKPGVMKLAEGARVADAITAAGGLTAQASLGELNLAQVLADGIQLKVGTRAHPGGWLRDGSSAGIGGGTASTGGDTSKISLNSATLAQLDTLPGIGPVTAQKILDWRKAHGRFTAVTELQEVDGIGPKTYADLADRVRL
jgi:competence protein ComEA